MVGTQRVRGSYAASPVYIPLKMYVRKFPIQEHELRGQIEAGLTGWGS